MTSTIREDCCENVDLSLALRLKPAFCPVLVLEFLSIHVLICVSVRTLSRTMTGGIKNSQPYSNLKYFFLIQAVPVQEGSHFSVSLMARRRDSHTKLRTNGNKKSFAWKIVHLLK